MEAFTTSTAACDVSYVFEEMVTLTVGGYQMVLPKRVVLAMVAIGQGMMLDQIQKTSQ